MTAPAIPESTIPQESSLDAQSAMEETIRSTLSQSNVLETPTERPRDEKGKFVAQAPTETPETAIPGVGENPDSVADTTEDAPAVEVPEGYALAPALPEDKAKGFTVRDAEGEIIPPDLTWELTANGKPRTLSTDKLVAFAQMGVYNHEREQAYVAAQEQSHHLQQGYQQLQATVQEREQQIERLLTDADYLVESLQRYEQYNTPEARAQRAQDELAAQRRQIEVQQMEQQAESFVATELEPALDAIAENLPTVSREELAARIFLASQRYRVDGILAPQGFDPLKQYILQDLVPWAKQLHESRQHERAAPQADVAKVKAQAQTDIEKAQVRAQKAKRQAAHALRPAGRATPESQPQAPIRTGKDAEAAVIGNTLAALRAG